MGYVPTEWADKEIYYDRNNWFKSDYMQTGNVEEQLKWVHEGIDKLLADHGYIHENGMFRIEKHSDETLVFFCHFGVSMVMIGHILGISTMNMWHGFNMQPTSVTVLGCEEREGDYGFFRCHVMGCTKHLAGGNEPISNAGYFTDVFQD